MLKARGMGAGVGLLVGIAVLVVAGIILGLLGLGAYQWIGERMMSVVGAVLLLIVHVIERI